MSLVFDVFVLFRSFFRARIMRAWCSRLFALASLLTYSTGRWSLLWPSLLFSSGSAASFIFLFLDIYCLMLYNISDGKFY